MLAAWSRKLDVIAGGGLGSAEEDRLMGGAIARAERPGGADSEARFAQRR